MTITLCYTVDIGSGEQEFTTDWFAETLPNSGDKILLQNCIWRVGGRMWIAADRVELSLTLVAKG